MSVEATKPQDVSQLVSEQLVEPGEPPVEAVVAIESVASAISEATHGKVVQDPEAWNRLFDIERIGPYIQLGRQDSSSLISGFTRSKDQKPNRPLGQGGRRRGNK